MRKNIFLLFIFFLITGGTFFLYNNFRKPAVSKPKEFSTLVVKHSSHLFDPDFFTQAVSKGQQYRKNVNARITGGIIPHHLLAAPLIAGFFEGLVNQPVDTVILLSTNHYGVGQSNIAASKGIWTTIFGDLEPDVFKVSQLENEKAVIVSEDLFETEHGIYGITPFIKKTFPDAKILPLVINSGTAKEDCEKLVLSLSKIFDDKTIILVSADFSHYLPLVAAEKYDKETLSAIESFDTEKVFNLDGTKNIDSPESVYVLLELMQILKATNPLVLTATNSAILGKKLQLESTTSYATIYFYLLNPEKI